MTEQRTPKLIEAFTFEDYLNMFNLKETELTGKIFDFPGGLSSFNATATNKGVSVISADPIYDMQAPMLTNLTEQQKNLWHEHIKSQDPNSQNENIAKESDQKNQN